MTPAPRTGALAGLFYCALWRGSSEQSCVDALFSLRQLSVAFCRAFPLQSGATIMKSFRRFLAILIPCCFILPGKLSADFVLVDHLTDSSNWQGQPLIAHAYPPANLNGAFAATAAFEGNGKILKMVSGMFAHDSVTGVPNGGNPTALDFRFSFFSSIDDYLADPFLESPADSNVFHRFADVSNMNDWLSPRGTSSDGHLLFEWTVDVESLNILTVPGQTHFVSLIPETNGLSGTTQMAASNASNAIGILDHWFAGRAFGPDEISELGGGVSHAAYRITTTAIPEPSSLIGFSLLAVVIGVRTFSSRRRNHRRAQVDCIHNSHSTR